MTHPPVSAASLTRAEGEPGGKPPGSEPPGGEPSGGGGPGPGSARPGEGSPFWPDPQDLFSWPDPRPPRRFAAGTGEPGWLTGKAAEAYSCDAKIAPMVCGHLDRNALARAVTAFLAGDLANLVTSSEPAPVAGPRCACDEHPPPRRAPIPGALPSTSQPGRAAPRQADPARPHRARHPRARHPRARHPPRPAPPRPAPRRHPARPGPPR